MHLIRQQPDYRRSRKRREGFLFGELEEMRILVALAIMVVFPQSVRGLPEYYRPSGTLTFRDVGRVLRITEHFPGASLQFLYAQDYEDLVRNVINSLPSETSGHMSFKNNGSVETLRQMFEYSTANTFLVLLESPSNVIKIFIKIKENMLKCHTVQWLLLMEEKDNEEEGMKESIAVLETLVPEGTNVRLFLKNPEGSLEVFLPFIDKYGVTRFQFNSKNPENAIDGGNPHHLKKDLHRYSLSGRQLTMAIKPSIFIFHVGRANPDGSYELVGGGELVIINALSYALNFTYKAFLSPDNSFGNVYPNGTATGIIGMVARREVTFGATALGITWDREAVVDFTTPYMFQRSLLFSRFPKEKNQALAVLSPYQLQVWISLTASILFIGPIAYLVSLLGSQCQPAGVKASLQWYSFNMFRNIVVQGNYIEGVSWSVRFILFIWFVFCLIFSALYSGVLTAVLAVPSYETPIDSLTDLPRASQEGFTISLLAGSSYVSLFKEAEEGIYKQIWNIVSFQDYSTSFMTSIDDGMRTVIEGKHVFIAGENYKSIYSRKYGNKRLHFGREMFFPISIGVACQSGSPITPAFTHVLLRLREAGIIDHWIHSLFQQIPLEASARKNEPADFSITVTHLQAGFYLFVIGLSVASVALLLEFAIFFHEREKSYQDSQVLSG